MWPCAGGGGLHLLALAWLCLNRSSTSGLQLLIVTVVAAHILYPVDSSMDTQGAYSTPSSCSVSWVREFIRSSHACIFREYSGMLLGSFSRPFWSISSHVSKLDVLLCYQVLVTDLLKRKKKAIIAPKGPLLSHCLCPLSPLVVVRKAVMPQHWQRSYSRNALIMAYRVQKESVKNWK